MVSWLALLLATIELQLLVVHFKHHICCTLGIHHHSKGIYVQLLQMLDPIVISHLSIWFLRILLTFIPTFLLNKKITVEAITDIKKLYNVTRYWQGDPCVPSKYSWDGLNCSDDNHPRIISLWVHFQNIKTFVDTCCDISINISSNREKSTLNWRIT